MRSLENILTTLSQATSLGKIAWQQTSPGRGAYVANLPGELTVVVSSWNDTTTFEDILSAELQKGSFTIDSVRADKFDPLHADLLSLFTAARRSATNVDAAIGELETFFYGMGLTR